MKLAVAVEKNGEIGISAVAVEHILKMAIAQLVIHNKVTNSNQSLCYHCEHLLEVAFNHLKKLV